MFTSPDQRARHQAFDRLVNETVLVLDEPKVRRSLGDTALQLKSAVESAVMPNQVGYTLCLPKQYADMDVYTLFPVRDTEDGAFVLDYSMLAPTAQRMDRIVAQAKSKGKTAAYAGKFVTESVTGLARIPAVTPTFKPTTLARHHRYFNVDSETGALYTSRPFIASRITPQDSVLGIGSRIAHEFTHARQAEATAAMAGNLRNSIISDELEAYQVEHDVINSLMGHPLYDTDMSLSTTSYTIEGHRQRCTHPDRPYEATPELVRIFDEYGLADSHSTFNR